MNEVIFDLRFAICDLLRPLLFKGVSLALLMEALLASWLPARHATRVDPVTALREQ